MFRVNKEHILLVLEKCVSFKDKPSLRVKNSYFWCIPHWADECSSEATVFLALAQNSKLQLKDALFLLDPPKEKAGVYSRDWLCVVTPQSGLELVNL